MISFKLKLFPQISETFIVSNLIYAKQKGFKIKIYVDKYLGLENSSQVELLKKFNIQDDLISPHNLPSTKIRRLFLFFKMLTSFKVLKFFNTYLSSNGIKWDVLLSLYQYRYLIKNEIVHAHFNNKIEPMIYLHIIGYLNQKMIITFHGYDAFLESQKSFKNKYGKFYKKNVFAVTVNSNYLKNQVIKLGVDPEKIFTIPIGIDTKAFVGLPKKLKSKNIKIITVGRIEQLKGHIYALKAIRFLLDAGYSLQYIIIGNGSYLGEIKKEIELLRLTNFVHLVGDINQQGVIKYLNDSDIFLMPSTYGNETKRREAFGVVSIEAQAMGLPVIGFNSGGFPETIINGETGFAVDDRSVIQLADKIKYLLENPQEYLSMSKAATKYSQNFDHKYTTQKYLDLYEKIQNELIL